VRPSDIRTAALRRLERQATLLGDTRVQFENEGYVVNPTTGERRAIPRWATDDRWITFECGCRAEWVEKLVGPKDSDPIVRGFVDASGQPIFAVYDFVCHQHNASMNVRLMGRFVDFGQWHRIHRNKLLGR